MSSSQFGGEEMLLADWPSVSFTPVNPSSRIYQQIGDVKKARASRIDRHDIYDIPPEPAEELQTDRKRKRDPENPTHSMTVSLALEKLWQSDARSYPSNLMSMQGSTDMVSPKLITTNLSKKAGKSGAKSSKGKQKELPGLSVTKPQARREKRGAQDAQSGHLASSHTTTEDLLRRGSLGLTTLEKLATFRYTPASSATLAEEPLLSVNCPSSNVTSTPLDDACHHPLTPPHMTGHILDCEPFFNEAFIEPEPPADRSSKSTQSDILGVVDTVATPIALSCVDVQARTPENSGGCKPFPQERDECDDPGLADDDLLAIADSLLTNFPRDLNIVDVLDSASAPDYGADMTDRNFPGGQSPDADDFPIDEDDEIEMSDLADLDVIEPLHISNADSALKHTHFEGKYDETDVFSGPHLQISGVDRSKRKANRATSSFITKPSATGLLTPYRSPRFLNETKDWTIVKPDGPSFEDQLRKLSKTVHEKGSGDERPQEDSSDYSPLEPFARPAFPSKIRDRSPVIGLSSSTFLRTCFRIGEAIRVGGICNAEKQDMVIELFARVKNSSRETGSFRQHFQFVDLFHDRPPVLNAILENAKVSALQETESSRLIGDENIGQLVRSLGLLKRVVTGTGSLFHIVNVRATDWEEVRWTKKIAGAGMVKSNVDLQYRF